MVPHTRKRNPARKAATLVVWFKSEKRKEDYRWFSSEICGQFFWQILEDFGGRRKASERNRTNRGEEKYGSCRGNFGGDFCWSFQIAGDGIRKRRRRRGTNGAPSSSAQPAISSDFFGVKRRSSGEIFSEKSRDFRRDLRGTEERSDARQFQRRDSQKKALIRRKIWCVD
ncbi:hypothetical protein U1Q18_020175 [Sarracenia purpurea var. burkii]